jgi:hypothetical protein
MDEQEQQAASEGGIGQSASTGGLARCGFFLHRWGKWKDNMKGDINEEGRRIGSYIEQERRCINCGIVQLRMSKAR